ncbi:MAG: Trm112 family protein [Thioalkalivibrionaceae bacterium]
MLEAKLLEILVCPVTKGPLIYDRDRDELISLAAGLAYPVRDDIPVMLEEEARVLEGAEKEKWRASHPAKTGA